MIDDQHDHPAEDDDVEAAAGGMNAGWAVLATLISGMLVWGGVGWLVDWWLGTHFALPIGLVLGMAGSIFLIVRKYSKLPPSTNDHKSK
jgi:F0F1-type ATP synthase assembly protein I